MNGWWCVAETRQGGGLPDTLHGPYWDYREAADQAARMAAESHASGRRDRFRVCELEIWEDDE
ncbi:hypothetical protein [Rhodococcus pyridinivorans]|uniref:Uncharacterized protein n=1 Tax=Rhodococcus pyridinivorans TaxID=103816 RepID=A0A7M2XNS8_9NOCA|nr:hypothetical protein [Rhodococcus pyridinivorans]QOV99536.1 hypothetical protein INP59_03805 [Rhodococcus pyridinivorans]